MLASILASGLAMGAVYALIGITYNVMFSASRVMSFTAGQLGMLGGVFGALFIARLGIPAILGLALTLAACAAVGVLTEIVAVRPVLKSLEKHLYVLSTLAVALMIQQFVAIEWSTEPQPFPRLIGIGTGIWDEKFWLPLVACAATIAGLELLYRRTLVGRAFLAIAEDNFAARALGLPERNLRMASFALAAAVAGLGGFAGGELLLAFFANGPMLNFYGFVPVALGGLGNSRGAIFGGLALGIFQQAANFLVGGVFVSVAVFVIFIVLLLLAALAFPLVDSDYWALIATRAAIYWVLVSGLNLIVGFAGQLAIGYVSLLTLGAYTASVLVERLGIAALPALAAAGVIGAAFGVLIGLPALRLRTFYFAMTTLGFATIVTQVALAWTSVTGGGIGLPGPVLPKPFDSAWGFYGFAIALAALCTWMTANIAASRFGRAMVAIRDAEVAAEATGIIKARVLLTAFLFSGAVAGIAGGLFASLQSYITPDAFTFDLSVLFFIAILIGGRGSILGPLLGTLLLTVLPEIAAPLVAWSTFLYAALLLVIVLLAPGGIAELIDFKNRRPLASNRAIVPRPELLAGYLERVAAPGVLAVRNVTLAFGGVRAVDGLDLALRPGEVHGLIGPNGSGKTTTLNVLSGFSAPDSGGVAIGERNLPPAAPQSRAGLGIARTFQTPRIIGEASVRALVKAIAQHGTGILLVEHHADLIFDICDRVTVLNLGQVLAAGTPAEIRAHREVVSAYLGG